jgi:hypothetical protein
MQKWEYKIIWNFPRDISGGALNALGADGWELVSVATNTAYFKRLLTPAAIGLAELAALHST